MARTVLQTTQSLPIPTEALKWGLTLIRPATLPPLFDERVPVSSIFYVPAEDRYITAMRCNICAKRKQKCDRDLPSCRYCESTGDLCDTAKPGYETLPGMPKRSLKLKRAAEDNFSDVSRKNKRRKAEREDQTNLDTREKMFTNSPRSIRIGAPRLLNHKA